MTPPRGATRLAGAEAGTTAALHTASGKEIKNEPPQKQTNHSAKHFCTVIVTSVAWSAADNKRWSEQRQAFHGGSSRLSGISGFQYSVQRLVQTRLPDPSPPERINAEAITAVALRAYGPHPAAGAASGAAPFHAPPGLTSRVGPPGPFSLSGPPRAGPRCALQAVRPAGPAPSTSPFAVTYSLGAQRARGPHLPCFLLDAGPGCATLLATGLRGHLKGFFLTPD